MICQPLAYQVGKYAGEPAAVRALAVLKKMGKRLFAKGIGSALEHVKLSFRAAVATWTVSDLGRERV